MAKSKPSPRILNRLFERTELPVYVVSPENLIVYANDACAQWVGVDREALISERCVFTSQQHTEHQDNEVQNRIQGLCPEPGSFSRDLPLPPMAVWALNNNGQKTWRSANMQPLRDRDQNPLGILVICQENQCARPDQVYPDNPMKPAVDLEHLHTTLAQIRTQTDQIYQMESLVGTSPFANRLRRQVKTAIESNADLLVTGPLGCGKEHLSRTIHATRDHDHQTELLPVHCSIADQRLIQQNIMDIVGSRAVVSAHKRVSAQDWLLLLDVDQLGEAAQNELLGFFKIPDFPLRTIATSTVPLIELASAGKYSQELAHHLSVMTIELVSLSARRADIPVLAQAFVERENFRREQPLAGLSNEVMQQFIEFEWTENIDQLIRTIQMSARNATGHQVIVSDLPDEFRHALKALRIGGADETQIELDVFLGEIEKELIVRALQQSRGNKTKASRLLGISRPKLLRRIQFFGLQTGSPAQDQANDELDSSAFEELD